MRIALALCLFGCVAPTSRPTAPDAPVRLLVEPEAGRDAVVSLLASARTSLWMEMYLLTDDGAIEALVERRRAGVDVRVRLEPHPFGADGANGPAFERLAAAGADVAWTSPRFALTHAKFAVVDGARLVAMTLNLTRAGLGANREYVVVDDDSRDVGAAAATFLDDAAGAAPSAPGPGRVVASPTTTRAALADAVARASRRVLVEVEELSDGALVAALTEARVRGAAVAVVLPGAGRSAATTAAARRLVAAGVDVRAVDAPTIHAKALLADDWLYVGSANLTTSSLDANRELGLALDDDAAARAAVAATIADDLASGHAP
jgi:phosphatidylserine/phosphatidylglycerophosphate/cardiolipin synthase-like enzyme